jgi:hypothetical protein
MPRYQATLETTNRIERVFAYLSDFSNRPEWDPGVISARANQEGQLGGGSTFEVESELMGRKMRFVYQILAFDPPRSVTLRGESATAVAIDQINLVALRGGTRISLDIDLKPKGALTVFEPLLARRFKAAGDRAVAGLKEKLGT